MVLLAGAVTFAAAYLEMHPGTADGPGWELRTPSIEEPSPAPSRAEPSPERGDPGPSEMHLRLDAAQAYAKRRTGTASIAVVDGGGVLRGRDEHRVYPSASVVKAMLLAAELRRLHQADLPVDPATESLLQSMITFSDNDAATAVYSRVGDAGMYDVAERAGMSDFSVAVSWGYAEISAADMALLFSRLDRVLPRSSRELGKGLLGSVVREQSWGIPEVANGWSVRFKGGWRATESGQLVSQAAELRRDDRRLAFAVLTDGQPSMEYGIESIEGIAERLLGG